jgi:hypothetical protein
MARSLAGWCAAMMSLVVGFGSVLADEGGSTGTADPTGTWKWERTFNDNTAEFLLKLNWDGKRLSGKYTAFGSTSDIEQSQLEHDELSFLAKREFNGNQFEVKFKGKVESDNLVGKITVDFGNGPQEFDWNAKRSVEVDDVLGTWNLRLEMPNGVIEPRLTITRKGEELHGAYVSPFGAREAKNVTLKDNQLSWEISGERDGNQFKVVYTGQPRGNIIEGTTEFDFNGNTGTMEFTGKRRPPEDEEKAQPAETEAGVAEGTVESSEQ